MIDTWLKVVGYVGAAVLFIGTMFFLGGNDPYYRSSIILISCLLVLLGVLVSLTNLRRRQAAEFSETLQDADEASKHWAHAKAAVKAAGWNSETTVLDIGFIAFWGKETAHTYRTHAIPTSADAVQPYIRLRHWKPSALTVEFTIENRSRQPVFKTSLTTNETQEFITPPARLPLRDLHPTGKWTLLVSVNGKMWAKHRFTWRTDDVHGLEGRIHSDGEVDDHTLALLVDNYAEPMSLDDLLAGDEDEQHLQS